MESLEVYDQNSADARHYWNNGEMKSAEDLLEEYRDAGRKKRDQMWFMLIGLRKEFDEIERNPDEDILWKVSIKKRLRRRKVWR